MPTPTQTRPLPPVPAAPPASPGQPAPPLDPRWLELLRRRLNSTLTGLLFQAINGFSSTVSTDSSNGSTTLSLSITASGMLKGSAGALVPAVPGTDYLQSITASPPLTISAAATPVLAIPAATSLQPGHLTAADHALFSSHSPGLYLQVVAAASGFTSTIPSGCTHYYLNAAAPLASGALALPPAPADAALITITCPYTVTILTNTPNAGQTVLNWPGTLPAGTSITYIYRASTSTWYRFT